MAFGRPRRAEREAEWIAAEAYVEARLEELRAKPWDELNALPEYARETWQAAPTTLTIGLYRHDRPDGSLRIVLQMYRPSWWGMAGVIRSEGLVVHRDGRVEPAPREELWDYE